MGRVRLGLLLFVLFGVFAVVQAEAGVLRLRRSQCTGPNCPAAAVAPAAVEAPAVIAAERDVVAKNPRAADFRKRAEKKAKALKTAGKSERYIRRELLRDAQASGLPLITILEMILEILQKLFPR
jgi:hypothetical protein